MDEPARPEPSSLRERSSASSGPELPHEDPSRVWRAIDQAFQLIERVVFHPSCKPLIHLVILCLTAAGVWYMLAAGPRPW
jgi:hypothetical protein